MKSSNIRYLPALDHLRGLAAMLVVFYHGLHLYSSEFKHGKPALFFGDWLTTDNVLLAFVLEGHTAVGLFMVLSGFLFTVGSYGRQIVYRRFLANRLLRIYPLYFLLLVVGVFAMPENFELMGFLLSAFGMANVNSAINLLPFSGMFWAVAIEVQFYLVFPLLISIVNRNGAVYMAGLLLVFLALRGLAMLEGANMRDLSYNTIVGRMDQFLIGILLGVFYRRRPDTVPKLAFLFPLAAGLALAVMYAFHKKGGWPASYDLKILWPTVEGFTWAVFIITYLSASRWIPGRVSKLLASLGVISYSLYLLHFIVIDALIKNGLFLPLDSGPVDAALLNTVFVAAPAIILLSILTYHFVEKPFLNMRVTYLKD